MRGRGINTRRPGLRVGPRHVGDLQQAKFDLTIKQLEQLQVEEITQLKDRADWDELQEYVYLTLVCWQPSQAKITKREVELALKEEGHETWSSYMFDDMRYALRNNRERGLTRLLLNIPLDLQLKLISSWKTGDSTRPLEILWEMGTPETIQSLLMHKKLPTVIFERGLSQVAKQISDEDWLDLVNNVASKSDKDKITAELLHLTTQRIPLDTNRSGKQIPARSYAKSIQELIKNLPDELAANTLESGVVERRLQIQHWHKLRQDLLKGLYTEDKLNFQRNILAQTDYTICSNYLAGKGKSTTALRKMEWFVKNCQKIRFEQDYEIQRRERAKQEMERKIRNGEAVYASAHTKKAVKREKKSTRKRK